MKCRRSALLNDKEGLVRLQSLDAEGYVILTDVVSPEALHELRGVFERAAQSSADVGGTRHVKFDGVEAIQALRLNSRITEVVRYILGNDFKAASLHGRDPLPGFGQQGLHADAPPRTGPYLVATAIWMLDDFTMNNGATRIVAGTHVLSGPVPKGFADPGAHHPKETLAIAPGGSVLIFNGHLWHSGTRNTSKGSRRALQGIYHRPEFYYHSAD
jgi:ectoine hydroxylase-related dioxygenase (phytanoyl-CoA dioxygenase family)